VEVKIVEHAHTSVLSHINVTLTAHCIC